MYVHAFIGACSCNVVNDISANSREVSFVQRSECDGLANTSAISEVGDGKSRGGENSPDSDAADSVRNRDLFYGLIQHLDHGELDQISRKRRAEVRRNLACIDALEGNCQINALHQHSIHDGVSDSGNGCANNSPNTSLNSKS